ncbi:hypothetical protein TrLO_g13531 [Triparma laevis f. longispina]|uniref:Uncharacterized protein n=1 Tax=Triparma laevis f. longispina TaxID=1714387 RepID=A0A9W7FSE3_9STRA|nr:hypothetical protein TrLO_g13531 [Triparma laevis f. longispina]
MSSFAAPASSPSVASNRPSFNTQRTSSTGSSTMTITQPQNITTSLSITPEIINVTLPSHPPSHVTWTSETIDNEFLNRKSSKRCCIFKKKREWDESSSESESDGGEGSSKIGRIARKKVPDSQRFHA